MGIKPEGTNPVVVPPDNVQTRWGVWEASIDTAGQQAGEVFAETHAIATSANSVAATALSEARTYHSEAVAATEELELAIDPEHPDSHIFRLIQSIEEAQNQALELHSDAIAANDASIQELTKAVTRTIHTEAGSDDYWTVSGNTLTPKPGWAGSVVTWHNTTSRSPVDGGWDYDTTTHMRFFPVPIPEGSIDLQGGGIAVYTINPGVARYVTVSNLPLQTMPSDYSWQTVAEWPVPKDTNIVANAEMVWAYKTWVADYGMRITLDGVDITSSVSSTSAPIIGHGPRYHRASIERRSATGGQMLRVEARADHGNSLNRQVRDVELNVTWIDGAA